MLWDVDYTLVSADGLGTRLYEVVFAEMFGRELTAVAPKAGRTDRAIIADTLALSGVPVSETGPFLASLTRAAEAGGVPGAVRPLAGAAEAIAALAAAGVRQSVLTGNIRPMAELKLARAACVIISTWRPARTATCTRSGPSWSRRPGPRRPGLTARTFPGPVPS